MELFRFSPGTTPVLVSVPHAGTYVPPAIAATMTEAGLALDDTDWHVDRLYAPLAEAGIGLLVATHSRYVVDLNRDPADRPLYPGTDNTEVVPTTTFDGAAIWRESRVPEQSAIEQRIERYWKPYHGQLDAELARVKHQFGVVVLWDGHSIATEVPRFFQGQLPHLNFGTAKGASCAEDLAAIVWPRLRDSKFSAVQNGRFTGGYITRHYGIPSSGVHCLQLEVTRSAYLNEADPRQWDLARARPLMALIDKTISHVVNWANTHSPAKL